MDETRHQYDADTYKTPSRPAPRQVQAAGRKRSAEVEAIEIPIGPPAKKTKGSKIENDSSKLKRTKGGIEMDNGPTRRQKDADTDIESDNNVEPYETPVALQKKKKRVQVIESRLDSEVEYAESEIEQKLMVDKKKTKKGHPDNATQVRLIDNEKNLLTAVQI
jgi:hypothetical protein